MDVRADHPVPCQSQSDVRSRPGHLGCSFSLEKIGPGQEPEDGIPSPVCCLMEVPFSALPVHSPGADAPCWQLNWHLHSKPESCKKHRERKRPPAPQSWAGEVSDERKTKERPLCWRGRTGDHAPAKGSQMVGTQALRLTRKPGGPDLGNLFSKFNIEKPKT